MELSVKSKFKVFYLFYITIIYSITYCNAYGIIRKPSSTFHKAVLPDVLLPAFLESQLGKCDVMF